MKMKKGFTLVELLVVVVVIAILASITFRLGGLGSDSEARNKTVSRMQRLENCISGYFAAYGSYPPVALQGRSRNIYYKVNGSGIQQIEEDPDTGVDLSTQKGWKQVEAACRAQPVAMRFPFKPEYQDYVRQVSEALVADGDQNMVFRGDLPSMDEKKKKPEWTQTQVFQFGLLSYLLPRYLVMMGYGGKTDKMAAKNLYDGGDDGDDGEGYRQWGDNNSIPCRFETGEQYDAWSDLNADVCEDTEKWKIAALPSQSITARWMPNLEKCLASNAPIGELYGVDVQAPDAGTISVQNKPCEAEIYSAGDSQSGEDSGKSQAYLLDKITCNDGWGNEFYYYSAPPYQGYRLWSAGPNGKTFPPWFPDEEIENLKEKTTIRNWLSDDIVHMSN